MTPKELVLGGYASFAEGDMESLAKIYHEDALIQVNGFNACLLFTSPSPRDLSKYRMASSD